MASFRALTQNVCTDRGKKNYYAEKYSVFDQYNSFYGF